MVVMGFGCCAPTLPKHLFVVWALISRLPQVNWKVSGQARPECRAACGLMSPFRPVFCPLGNQPWAGRLWCSGWTASESNHLICGQPFIGPNIGAINASLFGFIGLSGSNCGFLYANPRRRSAWRLLRDCKLCRTRQNIGTDIIYVPCRDVR